MFFGLVRVLYGVSIYGVTDFQASLQLKKTLMVGEVSILFKLITPKFSARALQIEKRRFQIVCNPV